MPIVALIQGMCPMCGGMGLWMVLFWVVLILLVGGAIWALVRRNR